MTPAQTRFNQLLEAYKNDALSRQELAEFYALLNHPECRPLLEQSFDTDLHTENFEEWVSNEERQSAYEKLQRALAEKPIEAPVRRLSTRRWWTAAAAVLIFAIAGYFIYRNNSGHTNTPATASIQPADVPPPASNRASITLADGRKVYLDEVQNGQLARQDEVKLVKHANGDLVYEDTDGPSAGRLIYNTLTNPKGSQVATMQLSDGTRIWLNAGSSLTYPVAFTGKERKVTITGEAYFEVAHLANQPFTVSSGRAEVTVLGTHFNVNAYSDEADIKVTLLQGSVKVSEPGNNHSQILVPGQQAIIADDIKIAEKVDIEETMAWKNGRFRFNGADIESIMRQVSRWYDVEIEYEGKIPGTISGGTSRFVNVSKLLQILELTKKVTFEVQGKKIIVKPL